ncbi:triacylglycerol lipase [Mycobacteroides saopaulense]|uniref:Triacylglycerol lipase n=1 Tax=Mycobacteroides saopaulense TaxID=1578165 RepID=A0A1X0JAG5_9MYCO|nr:lipase family protein [Mycobacteroides saopaulense]ORB59872.1 triacylglycerol lipase [Mycobacteroides saopaulense]
MTAGTAPASTPATRPIEAWPMQLGKPLPSPDDPFFLPPDGWEKEAPGTPLRRRRVRIGLFGILPLKLRAWQVLYRSTDLHGAPETTVTTVLVPKTATEKAPLLAFQSAIDAVTPKRFPSYYLQHRTFGINQSQNEFLLAVAALQRGWIVTVSDHEGPKGLWMAPKQPGYHVLDALRATIGASGEEGIPHLTTHTPTAVWGYSAGGTATAWAAELAGEYAPELNLVGALIGAPAPQPGPLMHQLSGQYASGLIIIVLAAMMRVSPSIHDFLQQHLTKRGRRMVEKAERLTVIQALLYWPFLDFNKIFDRPLEEVMDAPEIADLTDAMTLGLRTPTAPIYLYHSIHDVLLPISNTDQLAEDYIAGGAHVTYRRDRASERVFLELAGGHDALGWLDERMRGKALPTRPDVRTVLSTVLAPRALVMYARQIVAVVKLLTGRL